MVTSASPEGQLTEMRDAFLKNLAQEGGYDTYPLGKPEKRVHGLYIKHDGDTAAACRCILSIPYPPPLSFWSKNQNDFTAAPDMDSL